MLAKTRRNVARVTHTHTHTHTRTQVASRNRLGVSFCAQEVTTNNIENIKLVVY